MVDDDIKELETVVEEHVYFLEEEGIQIERRVESLDQFHLLYISAKKMRFNRKLDSDFLGRYKYHIASAVLEHIERMEQTKLIKIIVRQECHYFSKIEKEEIENIATNLMKKNMSSSDEGVALKKLGKIREKLTNDIIQSLNGGNCFNIRGFIDFRLKDNHLVLVEIVEKAIEEYLMKREFNDFIKLLRYFVDVQEPKVKIVHIALDEENKFRLYDEQGNLINNENLRDIAAEISGSYIGYDYLLVSSLITIAPEKIYIH